MGEIIFLQPVFKTAIWGGSKLKTAFGYDIPSDTTGECWAVSAHKNGDCMIQNGSYQGQTLSWLWDNHREIFGNAQGEVFPLLVKIIDAKSDLSIQVHPDDAYAGKHEGGSLGKTECWYILDCDEDATIIVGHNAKDKAELSEMISGGRWQELIQERPIRRGDFFQIEPGCVHAIKGGTMILETQQSSDITYRLYDYDRLHEGQPRELHIDKSVAVITCPHVDAPVLSKHEAGEGYEAWQLIACDFYSVYKWKTNGRARMVQEQNYQIVSVIEGSGQVNGQKVVKGSHFILPYGCTEVVLEGTMELIVSHP